jgi:D-xylose transport system permease protein
MAVFQFANRAGSGRVGQVLARLRYGELGPVPVLVGLVIIAVVFETLNPNFLTPRNLSNLILQIGVIGTVTAAVSLALLIGEIDLSVGAVAGVAAAILALVLGNLGWPGWAAIIVAIAAGALLGLIQGLITVFLYVPAMISTLAGLLAWQGLQLILLGPQGERLIQDDLIRSIASTYLAPSVGYGLAALAVLAYVVAVVRRRRRRVRLGLAVETATKAFARIGLAALALMAVIAAFNSYNGVPVILMLLVALLAVLTWFTEQTTTGRHIFAIGGNAEAARRAGIPVAGVRVAIFALVAAVAAWGGIISASRQFAVSIGTGGGTLLMDSIAAAVIGGTSLFGGRGRILNAFLGALVIGSVANGLDLLGAPSSIKNIATGAILVTAVAIDSLSRSGQNR